MKAVVWHGASDVRVERVPDPTILNPRDAIVRITTTAICGSDLHLFDGYIPTMQAGDILLVPKGTVHSVKALGDEPFQGVSVFAPAFDGKDRVMVGDTPVR